MAVSNQNISDCINCIFLNYIRVLLYNATLKFPICNQAFYDVNNTFDSILNITGSRQKRHGSGRIQYIEKLIFLNQQVLPRPKGSLQAKVIKKRLAVEVGTRLFYFDKG